MRVVKYPVDGCLDLHMFSPKDAPSLVKEYLNECLKKGIHEVRIVHGKGRGVLRRRVQAVLEKHPRVEDFKTDTGPSGWGATVVHLKTR